MNMLTRSFIVLLAVSGCGPADPCAGGGTATIRVTLASTISGAKGVLTGPGGAMREAVSTDTSTTVELAGVPSGRWSATGERYATPDTRVRTAYAANVSDFCVGNGATADVTVTWTAMPTSHKLWTLNGTGGSGALLAFDADALRASGTPSAVANGDGPFGRDLAFDKNGNLWSNGGTTADATLVMTEAAHLVTTAAKTADRSINIVGLSCLPATSGLAFDTAGNLWVASECAHKVYRLTPDQLGSTGDVTPAVVLGGVDAPKGVAFDKAGNLYVGDDGLSRIVRFDAAALSVSTTTPSALIAALRTDNPMDTSVLGPNWLAFDKDGNLWADDFGGNIIYFVAKANLGGTGEQVVTPGVRITLQVGALLEGIAFDEAGGLWVAYSTGKLARLDPTQLTVASGAGAPTVPSTILTSSDIGYASNMALYPAPAGLPLVSSLP